MVARDLTEPSPLALEVLSARPYAFLDDAPLEERRTQAVLSRRWLDPEAAGDLGALDPAAIARARAEAWPDAADADELHDALCWLTFMTEAEIGRRPDWAGWAASLAAGRRAARLSSGGARSGSPPSACRCLQAILPDARPQPPIEAPPQYARPWSEDEALVEIARGRLQGLGPVAAAALAGPDRRLRGPNGAGARGAAGGGIGDARPLHRPGAR